MGGFDDISIMGDWMPPSPSLGAFFSSMISDDAVMQSIGDPGGKNKSWSLFSGPEGWGASGNADQHNPTQTSIGGYDASSSNAVAEPKMGSCGGLMDRIAARAGFNAPRLNTETVRPAGLSTNLEARSPYLTIPPGLSPTTLLDSPVFVTNSSVLPSPTTGKFPFAPSGVNQNSTLMTDDADKDKENAFGDTSSFTFNPNTESGSISHFNPANNAVHTSSFASQSFPGAVVSANSDMSLLHQSVKPPYFPKSHEEKSRGSNIQTNSVGVADNSPPIDDLRKDDGDRSSGDRSSGDPNAGGGRAEDGYNWRKYGQKQVKGSEYPRSYYKCTHPNCLVKKKVERSHEGHITEIIYKGDHKHLKPPPSRRSSLSFSNALGDVQLESEPGTGVNGDLTWSNIQKGNFAGAADWSQENLEVTSSAPAVQECSNGATSQAQSGQQYESGDGVDGASTFSNDEDNDDRTTHGSVSLGYDGEGDESESKRRRIEIYGSEMSGATRAMREPRVVVQTTSEVDILVDGYRWRKYGQKVVKGNPNPRSYYKCTSDGCNVRKHVERASHDLKSVITTYEGKHNHDVPAARNSNHVNSGGPNILPAQQPPASAVSGLIHRPEPPQIHRSFPQFERPSLGTFGLPGRPQLRQGPGFGLGINQHGLASMGLGGLRQTQGKFPVLPVNPYIGHQIQPMNGVSFMLPKAEPKLEPVTDAGLNSSGGSVYQQLMSRLPLGPPM